VPIRHAPLPRQPIHWLYTPVWDCEQHSLVRFRLTSGGRFASQTIALGAAAYGADLRTVAKSIDDSARLADEGRQLSVIPVIHAASLTVAWRRDQLIELIDRAPRPIRRLLRLEVLMPEFAATEALARFAEALAACEVPLAVGVPLDSAALVQPAGLPIITASAEVADSAPDTLSRLEIFARRCAEAGLQTAAHGLDSRAFVDGAREAGVRFLSGEAIHAGDADLRGLRLEPADLDQRLAAGG